MPSRDPFGVSNDVVLALVVVTALGFDFTNGFHDTGNAMATSIATGALSPRVAVALSGVLNLVGAFLSLAVAATIASGLVNTDFVTLAVVAAGLAGGIIWNLVTWLFGIPSSSSHALIGGVIGATLAAAGGQAVKWHGLVSKVVIPACLSPIIAALVAAVGTYMLYRISRSLTAGARNHGFRIGQIGSACMVSLAHGTNDAQKTMGVITLALIANGTLASGSNAPFWVILSCAIAISLGTYLGGWRVIRTLGKGLVEIESPQGMAAESASAAVILLSSGFGYSLSTTHVATGSIIGTGLGKKGAEVRWNVAGRMATAWVFTLPCSGLVGAGAYELAHVIGGTIGIVIDLIVLVALAALIYIRSRASKVDHNNVNAEWTGTVVPADEHEPAAA
jgi:inorganic phosphate transporter, PiT family